MGSAAAMGIVEADVGPVVKGATGTALNGCPEVGLRSGTTAGIDTGVATAGS